METLTDTRIDEFIENGFVHLPGAFPRSVADRCREILWRLTGLDPDDPDSWVHPVIRIEGCSEAPFREAANTPRLLGALDQLVGPGRWRPRGGLGTFPIRFPHADDPGDAGWHVDASYWVEAEQTYALNIRSRGRALLMLFLFSDVGLDDAPTRIKVGSHLDVPAILAPAGEQGLSFMALAEALARAGKLDSAQRRTALATGEAGDVYLCHPFLVHAAQRHRGTVPRFMAQPPVEPVGELEVEQDHRPYSPVERAVRRALGLGGA
jgi:hypothetical protein